MEQHQPALGRLPGLVKKKENKNTSSPPLTSLFLNQIVTSYSKPKQT
jgi:hypothetical protein